MKKNIICLLLAFCIIAFLPSATALSLIGKSTGPITYIPGTTRTVHYTISDINSQIKVSLDAEPFSHVHISEVVDNQFDLIFDFPADEHIPSGEYKLALTVAEISESTASISTQVAVSKVFLVKVLSYEKDINVHLSVPSINAGNNLTLALSIESAGYPDIDSVQGKITIHNRQQKIIGTILTEKKPLLSLQSLTFTSSFDSSKLPTGAYDARAIVSYDGKFKATNATFLIGNMDLQVLNYTASVFPGFNDFSVSVKNNWGNSLHNVYAKIFVEQQELLQTPSVDLEPWQEGKLKAIIQIPFPPANYSGIIKLFFEGEQKEMPITLQVLPPPAALQADDNTFLNSFYFPLAIIVLLLLLMIIVSFMIFQKRSRRHKDDL